MDFTQKSTNRNTI
uniref:Uncharacterized protein n=1 Tax=Arundo donax TaxID=35708 RepID=A0A0A9HNS1_ARUDO